MRTFIEWDPKKLSVHVAHMDEEHQVLIAKMNALFDANERHLSRPEIKAALDDLVGFTLQHFKDEEAYMESIRYPELPVHRAVHQNLIKNVSQHVADFERTGRLSPGFFDFLNNWLKVHIMGIDMKYSRMAQAKAA